MTGSGAGGGATETGVRRAVRGWGVEGWPALARAVAAARLDLIHVQYQAGAFDGRAAVHLLPRWLGRARPVVVTFHDLCVPYLFPKAGPLRALALRALARGCAATVATNGEDHRRLRGVGGLGDRLHLIPIGSNIPPAQPSSHDVGGGAGGGGWLRQRLGIGPDAVLLAYFGLVSASKGLDTLLDALGRLEVETPGRYHLLIVGGAASATDRPGFAGGGDLAGALGARGLAGRATMVGALPPEGVAAHLSAADLAVLPYRDGASWRRGSLLAALAQGLPVVTTTPRPAYAGEGGGTAPLPRLRDDENALLVPPDDAGALAGAVARAGCDAALRARLASGARALARAFAWDAIAARHLALYDGVLRGRGARVQKD